MSSNEKANFTTPGYFRNTDMLSLLKIVWTGKVPIMIITLIIGAAAYLVNMYLIPSTYRSSFTAYVNNRTDAASSNTETLTSGDTTAAQSLTYTYAEILRSDPILEQAADDMGLDYTELDLERIVTTSIGENTQLVYVYVTMENPELACEYAKAIADIAPGYLEDIVEGTSMKIVSTPKVPARQYEPNVRRNTAVALMIGFLFGTILIVVMKLMNTVIDSRETMQEMFDIPIVGTIPSFDSEIGSAYGSRYGYGYGRIKINPESQEHSGND